MALKDTKFLTKFRGCLVGALLGDCLGSPYEGESHVSKVVLQKYFDKLEGVYFKTPVKPYTDDTAMTKCIAESLVSQKKFDAEDIAKRFVKEYFKSPNRGYGAAISEVFQKLRAQKFEDVFRPAREQFNGSGSYGNGGAMRVAPVSLFCYNNYDELLKLSRLSAEITHTHYQGYNGTILQAIAIYKSLHLDPDEQLDIKKFTADLISKMAAVEKDEEGLGLDDPAPYQNQLKLVEQLLSYEEGAHDEEVQKILGTDIAALYSVPTAIYCFLRAQNQIDEIQTDNPFRRTIQYAISLGGDTDTIASMAGAIAGAFYGIEYINESLQRHCEISDDVKKYADDLYNLVSNA